jgi:plasmid maintenance system antidote protein VapI
MKKLNQNHPGLYVKKVLKNKKLTTVKAAEILNIGRPALTNFLNGKSDLSMEMIARLEKGFGIKKSELLQLKQEYDNSKITQYEKELPINRYTTGNLEIRASEIELWSEKYESRAELAVFVRKLVNSTGISLTKVVFPGFENSERHGWDGEMESTSATQRIPLGRSGWELGVGKDPKSKADSDYKTRTEGVGAKERKAMTFVFVTPRNWKDKKKWEDTQKKKKEWADVRVYDASDLEQWIDQSNSTQSWFSQRMGRDDKGIWSLEGCWKKWALNSQPELNKTLFKETVETGTKRLLLWLDNSNPTKPFIITSDSHEEALAFLYCAFESFGSSYFDKTVVAKSPEALRKLTADNSKDIMIISSSEAEKELTGRQNAFHTIIIRHKNEVLNQEEVSLALDMPSHKAFKESLSEMGMDDDMVNRLIKDCGYSPTILRRLLTNVEAEKFPEWRKDSNMVRSLIPIALAGSWDENREADREIIKLLFGVDKQEIVEGRIAELRQKDSTLIWGIENKVGVKSKKESLFLVKDLMTKSDLKNFFKVAHTVLGEEDPALELPEHQRWMAAIHNKIRNHSGYLREGICETLVLLSVNGNSWFKNNLGIDVKAEVDSLITKLLKPFKQNTWLSQRNDLPKYAEASPEAFLKIIEEDLDSESPEILALFKPEKNGIFGGCPRASLLWALEILAWHPQNLLRVSIILARLSQYKIEDNYSNKPLNSLKNIFKSWLPQTSANIEQRLKTLSALEKQFPEIGWKICIDQIPNGHDVCSPSSRPRWRNDASGAGFGVSGKERREFVCECVDRSLEWSHHDENTFGDLLERLQDISPEHCEILWKEIFNWNASNPTDQQKSKLREYIRRHAFSRYKSKHISEKNRNNAKIAYDSLEPADLVWRHHWLFAETWVTESVAEIDDENYSWQKRDEEIEKLRIGALSEIWEEKGYDGIIQLISDSNACHYIGAYFRRIITEKEILPVFDKLFGEDLFLKIDQLTAGFLSPGKNGEEVSIIKNMVGHYHNIGTIDKLSRVVRNAPFYRNTWQIVSELSPELQKKYWSETQLRGYDFKENDLSELIDNLISVNRPRYALHMVEHRFKQVGSEQLVTLLEKIAITEEASPYQVSSYVIEEIFKTLAGRDDISEERLSGLEFLYIRVLEHSKYGIPNLEKSLSKTPQLFVQALALAFKRRDHQDDSEKWLGGGASNENIASSAYALLSSVQLIPGAISGGAIDEKQLERWINEVRELCKINDREEIGDQQIGRLFAKSPIGDDNIWPPKPIRNILEKIKSKHIATGISIGVYNSRGVVCRGYGGDQERQLMMKYRNWAHLLEYDSPYVAKILSEIADSYEAEAIGWDNKEKLKKHSDNY